MDKAKLVSIYNETVQFCNEAGLTTPTHKKIKGIIPISSNITRNGQVVVENIDTVSAIIKYHNTNSNIAVLNMASAKNKGGGVKRGAVAQEECLFRSSNLYAIPDEYYPLDVDEMIYSSKVSFIRNYYYEIIDPIVVDVMTVAALNLSTPSKSKDYLKITADKIYYMFSSAINNQCDQIILGAWGCGVYNNDPNVVSSLFKSIINNLSLTRYFDKIVFAIINDNSNNNFEIFSKTLG